MSHQPPFSGVTFGGRCDPLGVCDSGGCVPLGVCGPSEGCPLGRGMILGRVGHIATGGIGSQERYDGLPTWIGQFLALSITRVRVCVDEGAVHTSHFEFDT